MFVSVYGTIATQSIRFNWVNKSSKRRRRSVLKACLYRVLQSCDYPAISNKINFILLCVWRAVNVICLILSVCHIMHICLIKKTLVLPYIHMKEKYRMQRSCDGVSCQFENVWCQPITLTISLYIGRSHSRPYAAISIGWSSFTAVNLLRKT